MFRPGRDKGIATPIPLGLAALGVTTFLLGFGLIFQPASQWGAYFSEAILIGGIAEFLAGMWAFAYGDSLAATVFTFAATFYGWWGLGGIMHPTIIPLSLGMVFVVAGAMLACVWLASFYETAVFGFTVLFLWLSWVLAGCALFSASPGVTVAAGACAILSALFAAYGCFANNYNAAVLEDRLPLGETQRMRERSEQEELERLRRLHAVVNHQEIHA